MAKLPQAKKKKKKSYVYVCRVASVLSNSDPVDCGLPAFAVREGTLQARILEYIGHYWLPYLF